MKTPRRQFMHRLTGLALALILGLASAGLSAKTLQQAAQDAARQYDAKVVSAKTIDRGNRRVHEVKVLTKDGVVKTVRTPAPPKEKKGKKPDRF